MKQRKQLLAAAILAAFAAGAAAQQDKSKSGEMRQGATQEQQKQNAQQGTKSQDDKQARKGAERSAGTPGAPMIVLVPVAIAQAQDFGDGCWARLYDGQNFRGNALSLIGPVDMANMRTAFGTDWGGEFDSVETGPKATVTVYDNENYRDKAATIRSNQRIADLDEKMGLFEDIRSLKIACATGTAEKKPGTQPRASGKN